MNDPITTGDDHLEENIGKLMSSTEPRLGMPEPSKARVLTALLQGAASAQASARTQATSDWTTNTQAPTQATDRPDAHVPTELADGVSRGTRPIEQPSGRRHMPRRFVAMWELKPVRWSIAAAAAVAVITVIVPVGKMSITPAKPAYALEQTAAALAGKRSFHVKLWLKPDLLKEEFWAEFQPDGSTLRFRQEEESQTTVWQDNVKTRYFHDENVLMLTRSNGQENVLERTDPEFMFQNVLKRQAEGKAGVEIRPLSPGQSDLTVVATYVPDTDGHQLQNVMTVDATTYIVKRIELWKLQDGTWEPDCSLDILSYNEPIPPATYQLDVPADAAVIDQVNQLVGVLQDGSSLETMAVDLTRRMLESWQAGDFSEAALLFGGIQADYLSGHLSAFRPVGGISVGQAVRQGKDAWPFFEVPCRWNVQRGEGTESIRRTLIVRGEPAWQKVDDHPTRWWVDVLGFARSKSGDGSPPARSDIGLEQGTLSDKEIAVRVVRELMESVIAEDYAKAGKLVGGVPAEKLRERLSGRKVVRIVSIGEPELHEGKSDHYRVMATFEVQADGQKKVVAEPFSVEPVKGQPGRWEID